MATISIKGENPSFFARTSHTCAISDSVALRIHSSTKPLNSKIANLQKGVILMFKGTDVVGEGTGFGVPIGKYCDETFFSGSSFLQVHEQKNFLIIRKEFLMNLIARDRFRNFKLENIKIRKVIDFISFLYQKHKNLAKFILSTKKFLLKFGVDSVFIKTTPKGKVIVTYTIYKKRILVNLSFSQLDRNNLQKVFVLNEQGAKFFGKYSDSEGLKLNDGEIGAWELVTAQSAKISDKKNRVGFSLKNVEGTILRRGRETMEGALDWIGLDYELNTVDDKFEYEIEICG